MINSIGVCGSGTMGSGIALLSAWKGFRTTVYDLDQASLLRSNQKINSDLDQMINRKKISEQEKQDTLNRISFIDSIHQCKADLFIEAIIEEQNAKADLFSQLQRINGPGAIYATNTSSLFLSAIARGLPYPHRFAGLHFFNPAHLMKLVEVVRAEQTSNEVVDVLVNVSLQLDKTAVVCSDSPGFIVNHVARPYYLEALRLSEDFRIDAPIIDRLLESTGFKMGPFKLMDLIGNDINYAVSTSVYEALGEPARLKPSAIQQEMVAKGKLGRKTGEGYYTYRASER